MRLVDQIVTLLNVNPFAYMVIAIISLIVWTWCSAIGDFALTGRGIWIRRIALFTAGAATALFAYTARSLQ